MTFEASKPTNRRLEYGPDSIPLKQIYRKDHGQENYSGITLSIENCPFYIIPHMCFFSNTAIKMQEHSECFKGKIIVLIIWSAIISDSTQLNNSPLFLACS